MFTVDELVGLEFQGFFQRDIEQINLKRQAREKIKREHPEDLATYDELHHTSDNQDSPEDRKYKFDIKILDYNPSSGLFIAKGWDFYGDSGLVGEILAGKINFKKIYAGIAPSIPDISSRFNSISYEGTITKPDAIITCGGSYDPGVVAYRGTWRLDLEQS